MHHKWAWRETKQHQHSVPLRPARQLVCSAMCSTQFGLGVHQHLSYGPTLTLTYWRQNAHKTQQRREETSQLWTHSAQLLWKVFENVACTFRPKGGGAGSHLSTGLFSVARQTFVLQQQ